MPNAFNKNRISILALCFVPFLLQSQTPVFQTGNSIVKSLAVSPDGKTIAVEGESSDITLWDLGTRKKTITLKRTKKVVKADPDDDMPMPDMGAALAIGAGSTSQMYFSPDGQRLILSSSTAIVVWNVKSEKQLFEINASSEFFALSNDAGHIAVIEAALPDDSDYEAADIGGGRDRSYEDNILLFSTQTGDKKELSISTTSKVKRIRFVPKSNSLLVAGLNGDLALLDYTTGEAAELKPIYNDDEEESSVSYNEAEIPVMSPFATLAIHPKQKTVAICDSKEKLYLYDFGAEKLKHTIPLSNTMSMPGKGLEYLQFTPNGKYLVGINRSFADKGLKKQVRFWDVENGKEVKSILVSPVMSGLSFSPDEKYFALSKLDNSKQSSFVIAIYDAQTLAELEIIKGRGIPAFFPNDTKRIAFSSGAGIAVQSIK